MTTHFIHQQQPTKSHYRFFYTKSRLYFSHARTYKNMHGNGKKNRVSGERARSMKSTNKRPIEVLIILRISGYFTHAVLLAMHSFDGMKWHMGS